MRRNSSPDIIDLDFAALETHLIALAEKIRRSDFAPEHILYIERAGLYCAHTLSRHLHISASGIQAQRSANILKEKSRFILRRMPRALSHALRKLEIVSGLHTKNSERRISFQGPQPPRDRNLLILDDALDTGYSIHAVRQHLLHLGYDPARIKTAVLTITGEQTMFQPDFYLFDHTIVTFPWSYDSVVFEKAQHQYHAFQKEIHEFCHA